MTPNIPLLWDRLRRAYWFYPALLLLAGAALAFALTALDERAGDAYPEGPLAWIYQGSADGARAMLSAIATSVLGVAGVTFSITVAILSFTSSQFGPRLLRNFVSDTGNQVVLGTFIATFLYCLLVMRTVRSVDESSFVPHVSVTVGIVLALVCAAMLVYFIHHVVFTIQPANFIAQAGAELVRTVERLYPDQIGKPAGGGSARSDAGEAVPLLARRSGYIQAFDPDRLLALSRDTGAVIEVLKAPGDFVAAGTRLALATGGAVDPEAHAAQLDRAASIGPQATPLQDVTLPVSALTEIAMRALSPSLNDPNTAMMCIDRLGAGFCVLVGREFPSPWRTSPDGRGTVVARRPSFEDILHLGFEPILRHAGNHLDVVLRAQQALGDIASCSTDPARRREIALVVERARALQERLDAGARRRGA